MAAKCSREEWDEVMKWPGPRPGDWQGSRPACVPNLLRRVPQGLFLLGAEGAGAEAAVRETVFAQRLAGQRPIRQTERRGRPRDDASPGRFPYRAATQRPARLSAHVVNREESNHMRRTANFTNFYWEECKQGNALLRFLLVEAAQAAVRCDSDWRRRRAAVVNAQTPRKTNPDTLRSEPRPVLKKALTEPTLLEMSGTPGLPGTSKECMHRFTRNCCNFAHSALVCLRMRTSELASFHSAGKARVAGSSLDTAVKY